MLLSVNCVRRKQFNIICGGRPLLFWNLEPNSWIIHIKIKKHFIRRIIGYCFDFIKNKPISISFRVYTRVCNIIRVLQLCTCLFLYLYTYYLEKTTSILVYVILHIVYMAVFSIYLGGGGVHLNIKP